MKKCALNLMKEFSEEQLRKATYPFLDGERVYWYYAPINRHGLPLRDMSEPQKSLAFELMKTGLSEKGNLRANQIIQHEEILGKIEKEAEIIMWERDPTLYFFTIFGDPSDDAKPWGWRVEGHHLSLHFSIWGNNILSITPSFFGVNPARVQSGPHEGLEILAPRQSLALDLMQSLDPAQSKRALIFDEAPKDILTFSSARASLPKEEGLAGKRMSFTQKDILKSIIEEYIGEYKPDIADDIISRWAKDIDNIHFAWGGGNQVGDPHYYRLHGGTFLIEYDNVQNNANHIHSVWRDVDNDFAVDVLREHLLLYHIT
jgi:hypothetical protein